MDAERTLIVQFPCRKMKTFLFDRIISEQKIASSETLRWPILYLFPCSGNPWTILKPLHRQFFLPASIPAQTIFLISFNPYINNLCSATFIFQLSHSPCFKSSINHLSYWSSSLHKQSFLPASIPRQAILGTSATFQLSAFIPRKIYSSRYMTTSFCTLFM